jgi:DNA helicase-2/ATP-dependent DNA helicase PcrA
LRPFLEELGISAAWTGWVEIALGEDEIRRWLALAHLKLNGEDSLAWWTLLHVTEGIGDKIIGYVYDNATGDETFGQALVRLKEENLPDRPRGWRRVETTMDEAIAVINAMDLDGEDLDVRGWGGWLLDRMNPNRVSVDARRLLEMVGSAVAIDDGLGGLLGQLETMGKDLAASEGLGVRVMTMTGSKGLTVNTTIVMGVEQGIVPRDNADEAEERRLLYVAMTRATDMCVLTYAQRRSGPSARIGTANVAGTRNRSQLLDSLPGGVGDAQIGSAWVARLQAE